MSLFDFLRKLRAKHYTSKVLKKCAKVGTGLKVNGPSQVFGVVELGDNVNFNGMSIRGAGRCVIGNNFHSGINCAILTSNHNYNGTKIPYDEEMINKEVIIGDQVWIGDNVLILGGGSNRRRRYYSSRICSSWANTRNEYCGWQPGESVQNEGCGAL